MKLYALLLGQGIVNLIAVVLVMNDLDFVSTPLMNIAIGMGIINSVSAWLNADRLIIGSGIAFLKCSLTVYLAWGWWSFFYDSERVWDGLQFFWLMSPFLLVVGIFETAAIISATKKN